MMPRPVCDYYVRILGGKGCTRLRNDFGSLKTVWGYRKNVVVLMFVIPISTLATMVISLVPAQ